MSSFTIASLAALNSGIDPALVHYWPLSEASGNRLDLIGGTTLIPAGGSVGSAAGVLGNAVLFSGGDGKSLGTASNFVIGSSPFTLVVWAKVSYTGNGLMPGSKLFKVGEHIASTTWLIGDGGYGLRNYVTADAPYGFQQSYWWTPPVDGFPKNTWSMYAITWNPGGKIHIYEAGQLTPDAPPGGSSDDIPSDAVITSTSPLVIGQIEAVPGETVSLQVGPVMKFNSVLTLTQLDYLRNGSSGRSLAITTMNPTPDAVGIGQLGATLHLVGTGTNWSVSSPPTITLSGVSGVTLLGRTVNSPTDITVRLNVGSNAGTLTIEESDYGLSTTVTVLDVDPDYNVVYPVSTGYAPAGQSSDFSSGESGVLPPGTHVTFLGNVYVSPELAAMPTSTNIEVVFCNPLLKPVTIEAALQRSSSGSVQRLTFGGANSILLPAGGGMAKCDPFEMGILESDRALPIYTAFSWSGTSLNFQTNDNGNIRGRVGQTRGFSFITTDPTDTSGFASTRESGTGGTVGPLGVNAEGYTGAFVIWFGDSLTVSSAARVPTNVVCAGLDTVAYCNVAEGGNQLDPYFQRDLAVLTLNANLGATQKRRIALLRWGTGVVQSLGHNDVFNSITAALYTNRIAVFMDAEYMFSHNGGTGKRIQWTLTPKCETGANWTTGVGQVLHGNTSVALAANALLVGNGAAFYGVDAFQDLATMTRADVSLTPDPLGGYWRPGNLTGDGTHLSSGIFTPLSESITALAPWPDRLYIPASGVTIQQGSTLTLSGVNQTVNLSAIKYPTNTTDSLSWSRTSGSGRAGTVNTLTGVYISNSLVGSVSNVDIITVTLGNITSSITITTPEAGSGGSGNIINGIFTGRYTLIIN